MAKENWVQARGGKVQNFNQTLDRNQRFNGAGFEDNYREAQKVGFQTGQGLFGNLPQNIAENPTAAMMAGIPGVQAKAGSQIFGILDEGMGPETTKFSDTYLNPQTQGGKIAGGIGNLLTGLVGPALIGKMGVTAATKFPYSKTMQLRKAIPAWSRARGTQYADELAGLVGKSKTGGMVPQQEAFQIYQNILDNPDVFNKLSPSLQKVIQANAKAIAGAGDNVNAMQLIDAKRALYKVMPKGRKFDFNEKVIQDIGRSTGKTLEPYVEGLGDLNAKYADFFDLRKFANRTFKPWGGKYDTVSGEKALSNIKGRPEGTQRGLKDLEAAIKQFAGRKAVGPAADVGNFVGPARALQTIGGIGGGIKKAAVPVGVGAIILNQLARLGKNISQQGGGGGGGYER